MNKIAACVLAIVIILCPPVFGAEVIVAPQSDGSVLIVLPPATVKDCAEQGGCKIISRDDLIRLINDIKPKLCNEKEI